MSFAVIQNARLGKSLGVSFLGLVDRSKTKRLWWTSDNPSLLMQFNHKGAAVNAAHRLRCNNARAVPYSQAVKLLGDQQDAIARKDSERMQEVAMDAMEEGWDGHKHG